MNEPKNDRRATLEKRIEELQVTTLQALMTGKTAKYEKGIRDLIAAERELAELDGKAQEV